MINRHLVLDSMIRESGHRLTVATMVLIKSLEANKLTKLHLDPDAYDALYRDLYALKYVNRNSYELGFYLCGTFIMPPATSKPWVRPRCW